MSAWFSSDKPASLESLQFQFRSHRLQCFCIFTSPCVCACVRASLCLIELTQERIGCGELGGGRFHRTRHIFFYSIPCAATHLQRTGEQLWLQSGRFFKIHANISTPVRQMEVLPNSFHASTWPRANRKPLEGRAGGWRWVGLTGGCSLSITIL